MSIYFESSIDCDYLYFFELQRELQKSHLVRLPENILLSDLLAFIQSSLDQIKPVVLLAAASNENEINLSSLKSFHFKCVDQKFVFLNYSIRNSLSKFDAKDVPVKSFHEIQSILSQNLQK